MYDIIEDALRTKDPMILATRLYTVYKEEGSDQNSLAEPFAPDGLFNRRDYWRAWGWTPQMVCRTVELFCGLCGVKVIYEEQKHGR